MDRTVCGHRNIPIGKPSLEFFDANVVIMR